MSVVRENSGKSTASRWLLAVLVGVGFLSAGRASARMDCGEILLPPLIDQATNPAGFTVSDGAPVSFYRVSLTNVPAGFSVSNGNYAAWCMAYYVPLRLDTSHTAILRDSLGALPPYLQSTNWNLVNFILNHRRGGAFDVQGAIWHFIGGPVPASDPVFSPPSLATQLMIEEALANGEGFLPTGEGQVTAIILDAGPEVQTLVIEIAAPLHRPPIANPDGLSTQRDIALLVDTAVLLANDTDPDGGQLLVQEVSASSARGGTVVLSGNNVLYTPAPGFVGIDTFTYTITDGSCGNSTATVTVSVNPPPNQTPVANNDNVATLRDQPLLITASLVLTNDFDADGDTLVIIAVSTNSANGGLVLFDGVNILYVPPAGFLGADTFTYTVSDGRGGTATATVTVNVGRSNAAPVAVNDTGSTLRDQPLLIPASQLLANDADADGDPLAIIAVSTNSAAGGIVLLDGTNVVYLPPSGFTGSDTFTYTVSDGLGGIATATVTVTVIRPNAAPTPMNDAASTLRDQPVVIPAVQLLANDADADGDALTIIAVSTNSAAGGIVILDGTNIVYLPPSGFTGTDSFTYTVSDGQGGVATATVTVTVIRPNAGPTPTNDAASTLRDQPVAIPATQLLANDADTDGDTLTIIAVATNSAAGGIVAFDGTNVVYTPPAGFTGTDTFTYTVSDGRGGTATATVTVTVIRPNAAPIPLNDAVSTLRDQPLLIPTAQLLANDADPDGDALTITSVQTFTAQGGAAQLDSTTILYVPPLGFTGTDTFTYTVSDGHGGTGTATVTVTVIRPNAAPEVANDTVDTLRDQPVNIPVVQLLVNDSDADGDPLIIIAVSTNSARGGVVVLDGTNIVYTPPAGFVGNDTFTYTVSDGQGGIATATVTVTVGVPNHPPMAGNYTATTRVNTRLFLTLVLLLSLASDPDGDTIHLERIIAGNGATGAAQLTSTNVAFTPAVDFSGTHSFQYVVNDGRGLSATGTVTITIVGEPAGVTEEAAVFNPQTGLFEQRVTVSNDGMVTMAAFQLCISNLRTNIRVWNATGTTNGTNYVQYNRPLDPGQSVTVRIEYYVPDRRMFTPVIALKTVPPAAILAATPGAGTPIDRCYMDTRLEGEPRFVIEFTSTPGRIYTIIYSDDMKSWKTATPSVTAAASRTQWYDDGPPKTDSKPGEKGVRVYRVITAP